MYILCHYNIFLPETIPGGHDGILTLLIAVTAPSTQPSKIRQKQDIFTALLSDTNIKSATQSLNCGPNLVLAVI